MFVEFALREWNSRHTKVLRESLIITDRDGRIRWGYGNLGRLVGQYIETISLTDNETLVLVSNTPNPPERALSPRQQKRKFRDK